MKRNAFYRCFNKSFLVLFILLLLYSCKKKEATVINSPEHCVSGRIAVKFMDSLTMSLLINTKINYNLCNRSTQVLYSDYLGYIDKGFEACIDARFSNPIELGLDYVFIQSTTDSTFGFNTISYKYLFEHNNEIIRLNVYNVPWGYNKIHLKCISNSVNLKLEQYLYKSNRALYNIQVANLILLNNPNLDTIIYFKAFPNTNTEYLFSSITNNSIIKDSIVYTPSNDTVFFNLFY